MTPRTREELLELASLFALGATTPEESAVVEEAMGTDAALAAEVESLRAVAGALGRAAAVSPSEGLRAQLLSAARAERGAAGTPPRRAAVLSRSAAPRRASALMPLALAAALLAAIGLGTYAARLRTELDSKSVAVAALAERLSQRERTLNTMLEADRDLYLVRLEPVAGATGPGVQFFWNVKQGRAVAHVFRLPPAPGGRDYQFWALVDGKPVSLAVFNSDATGHALVEEFTLPASPAGVTAVLVSLEPTGGSPQPTTAPFLAGTVQAGTIGG